MEEFIYNKDLGPVLSLQSSFHYNGAHISLALALCCLSTTMHA